jgi:uncharacterized protein YfiM (DUF2279 family)
MKSVTSITLGALLVTSAARASDCFTSELSHFAGNAAIAGATTVVVHRYYPKVKKPALTGFLVSSSESFLGEVASRATGGKLSWLDVAAGVAGAAAGAYATDKWYIAPRINSQKGETSYGLVMSRRF